MKIQEKQNAEPSEPWDNSPHPWSQVPALTAPLCDTLKSLVQYAMLFVKKWFMESYIVGLAL